MKLPVSNLGSQPKFRGELIVPVTKEKLLMVSDICAVVLSSLKECTSLAEHI